MRSVIARSLSSWIDHRPGSRGAALAFYTLFSVTPILVLASSAAGHLFGAPAAQEEIIAQVQLIVGREGAKALDALLAGALGRIAGLAATMIAAVLLLLAAGAVFVELKGSIDEIWGVEPPRGWGVAEFLRTQLHSFGLVLVLAFLLFASLLLGVAQELVERHVRGITIPAAAVSIVAVTCLFAVIYKVLTEAPLSWGDAWIGAAFTAALFSLGKLAIGLYLANSGVASGFGAAGSLIALLLWIFYSSQIFLLGAEFTRQYALAFGSLRAGAAPRLST